MKRQRTRVVRLGVVKAQLDRLVIRVQQARFLAILLVQHHADNIHVDVEQRDERADIGNVAQQRAISVFLERGDTHAAKRDPENGDAFTHEVRVERPRGVIQQIAARSYRRHILRIR